MSYTEVEMQALQSARETFTGLRDHYSQGMERVAFDPAAGKSLFYACTVLSSPNNQLL